MQSRLLLAAAASLALASCASTTPPPVIDAAPPPPVAAPAPVSFDGVYKGQAKLTKNGSGRCYAHSGPARIAVANNAFRTHFGSAWVSSTIGGDGTISGSQGHVIVTGTVTGGHMAYTIGTQQCQLAVAADKS